MNSKMYQIQYSEHKGTSKTERNIFNAFLLLGISIEFTGKFNESSHLQPALSNFFYAHIFVNNHVISILPTSGNNSPSNYQYNYWFNLQINV